MSIRFLLAILLMTSALSGCGRKGALEMPPAPDPSAVAAQPVPSATASQGDSLAPGSAAITNPQSPRAGNFPDQQSAGAQEPAEAGSGEAPKRRFFLDRLL